MVKFLKVSGMLVGGCVIACIVLVGLTHTPQGAYSGHDESYGWLVLLALLAFGYFLPAFVAGMRRHRQRLAIVVLNVLLGWMFIPWVIALVWSLTSDVE